MASCPACHTTLSGKDLSDTFTIKPYRVCPHCRHRFTVDAATKRRQYVALLIALFSLATTIGWYHINRIWLLPAIGSYILLAVYIRWGNRQVRFVSYHGPDHSS